eukprot:scaffold41534_cov13-Tisochrysis_lutea.AAC.1
MLWTPGRGSGRAPCTGKLGHFMHLSTSSCLISKGMRMTPASYAQAAVSAAAAAAAEPGLEAWP